MDGHRSQGHVDTACHSSPTPQPAPNNNSSQKFRPKTVEKHHLAIEKQLYQSILPLIDNRWDTSKAYAPPSPIYQKDMCMRGGVYNPPNFVLFRCCCSLATNLEWELLAADWSSGPGDPIYVSAGTIGLSNRALIVEMPLRIVPATIGLCRRREAESSARSAATVCLLKQLLLARSACIAYRKLSSLFSGLHRNSQPSRTAVDE